MYLSNTMQNIFKKQLYEKNNVNTKHVYQNKITTLTSHHLAFLNNLGLPAVFSFYYVTVAVADVVMKVLCEPIQSVQSQTDACKNVEGKEEGASQPEFFHQREALTPELAVKMPKRDRLNLIHSVGIDVAEWVWKK